MGNKVPKEDKIASSRLARLDRIKNLIKSRPMITSVKLAEILEISPRQVQRDIVALMTYGVPIQASQGRNGGYSLPRDYVVNPDMFSSEEVKSLSVGGESIFGHTDLVVQEAIQTAVAKLSAALPEKVRREAQVVTERIFFDHSKWYLKYYTSPLLEDLYNAVLRERKIKIEYTEWDGPTILHGLVDPYGLVCKADTWYLIGYLHESQIMRRFNLSRVINVEETGETFQRTESFSLQAFWRQDLEEFGKGPTKVVLLIGSEAWQRLQNLTWKQDNIFTPTQNGMQVTMFVKNYEWIIDLVLVNRGEVVILEPDFLRNRLTGVASRVEKLHKGLQGLSSASLKPDKGVIGLEILENMSVISDS